MNSSRRCGRSDNSTADSSAMTSGVVISARAMTENERDDDCGGRGSLGESRAKAPEWCFFALILKTERRSSRGRGSGSVGWLRHRVADQRMEWYLRSHRISLGEGGAMQLDLVRGT